MAAQVACYSGGDYADRPRAFLWQSNWYEVAQVLDRQRHPFGKSFRVRTRDGGYFDLSYDQERDEWRIVPLNTGETLPSSTVKEQM